jgi:hypothetical protein
LVLSKNALSIIYFYCSYLIIFFTPASFLCCKEPL